MNERKNYLLCEEDIQKDFNDYPLSDDRNSEYVPFLLINEHYDEKLFKNRAIY